eukprot:1146057-Pelagomonas_calceolata.AAC.1
MITLQIPINSVSGCLEGQMCLVKALAQPAVHGAPCAPLTNDLRGTLVDAHVEDFRGKRSNRLLPFFLHLIQFAFCKCCTCRQGAQVTAVEANGSTADLCQSIICVNQALGNISVHHKDARHLSIGPDLPWPHDVLVFEMFDCGLLGEGALHILASARSKGLLANGATIIPCKAKASLMQNDRETHGAHAPTATHPPPMRRSSTGAKSSCKLAVDMPSDSSSSSSGSTSLDAGAWDAFQWNPDYIGLDLAPFHSSLDAAGFFSCPAGRWRPISQPTEVMAFDFQKGEEQLIAAMVLKTSHPLPEQHFRPEEAHLTVRCSSSGCINAVSFWFELQLEDEQDEAASKSVVRDRLCTNRLSTGPFDCAPGSRTWQANKSHGCEASIVT